MSLTREKSINDSSEHNVYENKKIRGEFCSPLIFCQRKMCCFLSNDKVLRIIFPDAVVIVLHSFKTSVNEDSTLLCALDRIFDEATVFKLRGESFRGKKLDTVPVQTCKVKVVEPMAGQQE